ncbi:MAG: glycosyltransferase family 2 protein [Candidatus Levybacteria bacterium]|nr:glycosyltransferase family 2 protein [Candidatus Levybacteria bacterium]
MSKPTCTCVIPFYNERKRILSVLRVVTKIRSIDEIICVDDGSTDGTRQDIKKRYRNVRVIRLMKNQGKAQAIKYGLMRARGQYILLLDADLSNLNENEIERAIVKITKNDKVDMIVLRRKYDPFISKIVRGDVLVSGERIVKKDDLERVFEGKVNGYQIEPAINYYMMDRKKSAFWMWHSGTNTNKLKKIGLMEGLTKESKLYMSIIAYKGPWKYIRSVSTFCLENLKDE